MSVTLADKVVVITGAGQGLGRAYALAAAADGAHVVVNDVNGVAAEAVVAEIVGLGGEGSVSTASVTDHAAVGRDLDDVLSRLGRLDGVVNNAGLFGLGDPWELDPAACRAMVEVNVFGPINVGAHALRIMRARGAGSVVNVISGSAFGQAASSVYGATKGAVLSLTYGWAFELAGSGIRVNAVSPMASTSMTEVFQDHFGTGVGGDWPAERVAPLVSFLLSDASSGVHGQVLRLDRGSLSLLRRPRFVGAELQEEWTPAEIEGWARRVVLPDPEGLGLHTLHGVAGGTPGEHAASKMKPVRP
ncbi:MAG TPA: SDR family oxidoreductase [Acidimicrobiales bacterium]|nr:SDR family oxidoreductase [Acidimicrobiales bacterium]